LPKYTADHYEIRLATTEAGLATAPALGSWESITFQTTHGRKKVPSGIGSRLQEVHETLLDYSGSVSGWYDETAVAGSSDVLAALQMYQQGAVSPIYLRLTNKISGKTITLKKLIGDPAVTIASPEDFVMWSWDFDYEDVAYT